MSEPASSSSATDCAATSGAGTDAPAASGTAIAAADAARSGAATGLERSLSAAGLMTRRFRGFLPVVVDVETGGFNAATDALLEIAAVLLDIDAGGELKRGPTVSWHVQPFPGSRLDPAALSVTGIDPFHPLRPALPERDALQRVFREVRHALKAYDCRRAILVGHNAAFDLAFLNAAIARTDVKRNPFHPFSSFDTATLAGAALGQTVLAKAVTVAGLPWDASSAHSAVYDAERTADLFCHICNAMRASYARAEERACALGWLAVPAPEAVSDDPRMQTGV